MKFVVSVEKRMYATGSVTVEADNEAQAIEMVNDQIDSGKLQTTDIVWSAPQYEDLSFVVTGDVD